MTPSSHDQSTGSTSDPAEIRRFDDLAAEWWDAQGPMAALHKLNPVRLAYVRDQVALRLGRDPLAALPLAGLRALDVGCGAGLLSEPLARLGAEVTGIDLAATNLHVARRHAEAVGLEITYRESPIEALAGAREIFDLVCCMEVVEHVTDASAFLEAAGRLVAPGGALVLATLNRTMRSYVLGILVAENLLGFVPRGAHQWSRFVRPAEAARPLRRAGLQVSHLTGVTYDPLRDRFRLSDDPAVNYMLLATRD